MVAIDSVGDIWVGIFPSQGHSLTQEVLKVFLCTNIYFLFFVYTEKLYLQSVLFLTSESFYPVLYAILKLHSVGCLLIQVG